MSSTERTTTTAAAEGEVTGAATEHTPMEGISSVETATTATATTATGKGKAVVQPTEEEDDSSDEEIPELVSRPDINHPLQKKKKKKKNLKMRNSTNNDDDIQEGPEGDSGFPPPPIPSPHLRRGGLLVCGHVIGGSFC